MVQISNEIYLGAAEETASDLNNYYTKAEVNTALAGKASTSLDNLTADGQMIIDSQNGTISNCVLEIPQNIKVILENNVLTVKSGSILTKSGNVYTTSTTVEDKTRNLSSLQNGKYVVFSAFAGGAIQTPHLVSRILSGDTVPTISSSIEVFYLTTDKTFHLNDGTQSGFEGNWPVAYPLCLIEMKSGVASFAKDSKGNDMIFNGAGFIGHHAFVYPNVRKLICNGKADSKLNSYDELVNGLYIVDLGQSVGTRAVISRNSNTYFSNIYWEIDKYSDLVAQAGVQYCRETNYCYSYTNGIFNEQSRLALAYVTYDGTTVTDFTIRQPYQGARNLLTDDLYKQIGDVETLLATV